ncbi:MAG: signal peptidase II, partial [Bacteroidales bacterium]
MPTWVPIWGGQHFVFFRPVFNIADSAITIGVFYLILFHRSSFLGTKAKNLNQAE